MLCSDQAVVALLIVDMDSKGLWTRNCVSGEVITLGVG